MGQTLIMRSTTSSIEALRSAVNGSMSKAEFDEIITEIQADALSRTSRLYDSQYHSLGNETDSLVSKACSDTAEYVRNGTYVMTVGQWGLPLVSDL